MQQETDALQTETTTEDAHEHEHNLNELNTLKNRLEEEPDVNTQHEDEHSPAEHVRHTTPWKLHSLVAKWPLSSCLFFCSWFIICALLVAFVPNLLAFSNQVPFYIRDNQATQNSNALTAGQLDASWQLRTENVAERLQEAPAEVSLTLLFRGKDGRNLAQAKYLALMDEIEDTIKATNGFEQYCKRLYSGLMVNSTNDASYKCARQTSLTNFFDASFFKPSVDRSYTIVPSRGNLNNFFTPLTSALTDGTIDVTSKDYSDAFVDEIVSYWAGYDQGHGPSGQYVQKYYNGEAMPPKFTYQFNLNGEPTNFSVGNIFAQLAGKNFARETPLDTQVDIAMSIFSFGLPLEGYTSSSDNTDDQQSDIGQWCFDELHDVFLEFQEQHADEIDFYWQCSNMAGYYTSTLLLGDGTFIIFTFLSVYLLMIYNTGSLWLASAGMAMIFMNFFPAIILYRYISWQSYFGTLCVLAMFIILSIGADDIFVIADTFAQYRTVAPHEPLDKRLTATLKHAGKVMATTSLSTCFSFIANATSSFPAVYTFGFFAAWLVFVNYFSVVLFYPCVLAVHDAYFYTPNLKRGWCFSKKTGANNKRCCFADNEKAALDSELDEEDRGRPIDKFFENRFYMFVVNQRNRILAFTVILFLIFFFFAARLEPDPNPPAFFPEGDNYAEFGNALGDNYAGESARQLRAEIVWGIEGIDRSGTDPTVNEDIGQPVYSDVGVSFTAADEQRYIASFCDDLLCLYSDYDCRYGESLYESLNIANPARYNDERINVVKCFMTEFREWVLTDSAARPNRSEIEDTLEDFDNTQALSVDEFDDCEWGVFPVENELCVLLLFTIWQSDDLPTSNPDYSPNTDNYDYWKSHMWAKQEDGEVPQLKFFTVAVLTEAGVEGSFNDGIALFENWNALIDNWRTNVDGQTSVDRYGAEFVETPSTLSSVMVTDGFIFSYYYLQQKIIQEAFFGIGLSLLFALIILTFATGNFLMAVYSTFCISAIVGCVLGFAAMNGWKLGVVESIIFVMVVGMSVDYVVHLSEAYLASGKYYRGDRTRRMLGIVAGSVFSGAISTLIGIFWLFFATVQLFYKFGAFIFFLICVSAACSLLSFTAALTLFGPEGSQGNVMLFATQCWTKCRNRDAQSTARSNSNSDARAGQVEMS
eukprot:CAMPEP_0202709734 /NCGR_PEP_ID=MMETSP1385-20130828/21819_1 /ASSEMBLY_ACC=CAM_ASM_000861 /TAXON_ID=933848 /ORGANISM="Elphidium margaritaceum" /LENGTH=1152 /DNA_ID=CAMNT_0049369073 /DNA_START=42 /DNA_END=3500 /DNA_ORIENTATION=+